MREAAEIFKGAAQKTEAGKKSERVGGLPVSFKFYAVGFPGSSVGGVVDKTTGANVTFNRLYPRLLGLDIVALLVKESDLGLQTLVEQGELCTDFIVPQILSRKLTLMGEDVGITVKSTGFVTARG